MPVDTSHIKQDCLHACTSGAEIIDRVDVSDVKTLVCGHSHIAQGCPEYRRMGLLASDIS